MKGESLGSPQATPLMGRAAFVGSSAAALAAGIADVCAAAEGLPLHVATNPSDPYAAAYYAADQGFFAKAGLDVDLETLMAAGLILAGVTAGNIDIGTTTPISIASASVRGFPLVMVAGGALSTERVRVFMVVTTKNVAFTSAKEFEGKTIAINALKSASEVTLDAWLAKYGADPFKVKKTETNFPEMGAAVARGAVAAAVIVEPFLDVAVQQYDLQIIGNPGFAIGPSYLNSVWFSTRDYAQAHPEVIARFQKAIYDAQRWANKNTLQSGLILAKYAKMNPAVVRTMIRSPYAERLVASDVQPFLDAASKYGVLPRPVVADTLIYHPS